MKSPLDLTQVNGFAYKRGDLILSPNSPMDSAYKLLADRYTIDAYQLLYHYRGSFFGWKTTHYQEITNDFLNADIYHFLNVAVRQSKDEETGKVTHVPFHPKATHVNEIRSALKAPTFLSEQVETPSWIGERIPDIEPADLLSCANGILHLPSRSLIDHTPQFFSLNAIDYDYEPQAKAPRHWLQFLAELWPGDEQSIQTLQEIFGYCLVADTSQQKAFMIIGPKRSGKGTIARVLQAVIGTHNVVAPTLAGLGTNFGMQPLIGKRLAIISDARISGKTDTAAISEHILSVTGEDLVTVDRKNREAWNGKLDTRFIMISNELPKLNDASGALVSRFILLIMQNSFYGQEDRGLINKLLAERPGILNWAIEGYDRLCKRGFFLQPASANDALRALEELGSPISAFVRDRCKVGSGLSVPVAMLFAEWQDWCDTQGRDFSGTSQSLGALLRTVIPGLKTNQQGPRGERERYYQGIAVAAPQDTPARNGELPTHLLPNG